MFMQVLLVFLANFKAYEPAYLISPEENAVSLSLLRI